MTRRGTWFVRCGDCEEMYVPVVNLLNEKPLWTRPKVKRGGCQHDINNGQWWDGEDWHPMATLGQTRSRASAPGSEPRP